LISDVTEDVGDVCGSAGGMAMDIAADKSVVAARPI
jgi:hypothetical protein